MKFTTILADPPWSFLVYSDKGKGKSPDNHYTTMSLADIKEMPVQSVTDETAALYLWVPDCNLKDGLDVMDAWGFQYKSMAFVWYKTVKDMKSQFKKLFGNLDLTDFDFDTLDVSRFFRIGLGYHSRKQTEICLYGTTKNNPPRKEKGVRQVIAGETEEIFASIGQHSAKPKEQYKRIEALSDGPYLELFAREASAGWTALGNEIDGKDIRDALRELKGE